MYEATCELLELLTAHVREPLKKRLKQTLDWDTKHNITDTINELDVRLHKARLELKAGA